MMDVGAAERSDPYFDPSAAAKIIGGLNTSTTTSNVTNLSPLNQIGSILSAAGGSVAGADKFLKSMGIKGGLSEFLKSSGVKISGSSSIGEGLNAGTYPLADGGNMVIGADGSRQINSADGTYQIFDKDGNEIGSGRNDQYEDTDTDLGGGGDVDYGGGDVEYVPPYYDSNPAPDWSADESYD